VEITTININHTRLASGIALTTGAAKSKKKRSAQAATRPDSLVLHPDLMLMMDCQIIASHHIPHKNQLSTFAAHCAMYSLFIFHLVSVISSSTLSVNVASVSHTSAATSA